jgi:hypothetical protein
MVHFGSYAEPAKKAEADCSFKVASVETKSSEPSAAYAATFLLPLPRRFHERHFGL